MTAAVRICCRAPTETQDGECAAYCTRVNEMPAADDLSAAVAWLESDYFNEMRARFRHGGSPEYGATVAPNENNVDVYAARWPTPAWSVHYLKPKPDESALMRELLTEEVPGASQQ